MSTCPVPDSVAQTSYSDVLGTLTSGPPTSSDESCSVSTQFDVTAPPGSTTVVNTSPSTTAGPPGPQGPQGPAGDDGCGFQWQGDWLIGTSYTTQSGSPCSGLSSVVHQPTDGTAYICKLTHIAGTGSEPGVGASWPTFWDILADSDLGLDEKDKNIFDTFFDHVKDIPNWGFGDWVKAIGLGVGVAGVLWLGNKLIDDLLEIDGIQDGNAGGLGGPYNGDPSYTGAFTPPTLDEVLEDLCLASGLSPSEFDVTDSALSSISVGFLDALDGDTINVIELLALAYQFDIVDTSGVLKFVTRKKSSVVTLGLGDIGFSDSSTEIPPPYIAKRFQGRDLPNRVELVYFAENNDYNTFSQTSGQIQTRPEGKLIKLNVPASLTDQQAKDITDEVLVNSHLGGQLWSFTTTYKYAYLEPSDIINAQIGPGQTYKYVRIVEITEERDGLLNFVVEDAGLSAPPQPIYSGPTVIGYTGSTYIGTGEPAVAAPTSTNVVPVIGYSQGIFFDLPPRDGEDKTWRLVGAIHGFDVENWPGANIYRSVDGGNSYQLVKNAYKQATVGGVRTKIASPPNDDYFVWDETTTVDVEIKTGTLTSRSESAVLNGLNHAMIGQEMIAFKTATFIGYGSPGDTSIYRLSGLLRGRQGTEWVIIDDKHVNNEIFVLIDDALVDIPLTLESRLQPIKMKTVTIGGDISQADEDDVALYGVNHIPWRVAAPHANQQPNNDWIITWTERPKWSNQMKDYTEAIRDTDWSGWTVNVIGAGSPEILRTEHVGAPTLTYTEQQQLDDFGVVQTCITVDIIANSTTVGGGYSRRFTCTGSC